MSEILAELQKSVTLDSLYWVYAVTVFFDIVCGMVKAWKNDSFKSRTLRNGLFASCGELILLALCIFAVALVPIQIVNLIVFTVLIFMIIKEVSSILENLTEIGVRLPTFLVEGLKVYADRIDKGEK